MRPLSDLSWEASWLWRVLTSMLLSNLPDLSWQATRSWAEVETECCFSQQAAGAGCCLKQHSVPLTCMLPHCKVGTPYTEQCSAVGVFAPQE